MPPAPAAMPIAVRLAGGKAERGGGGQIWEGLIEGSPHGCRIHLTGGEPFGGFELLLEICRSARRKGLGPLE